MELAALSRELIRANTVSNVGTSAAVEVLRPLYQAAGMRVWVQETRQGEVRQQNLLGTYPGEDPRGLLLVTHLDTVDPGPLELWTETGGDPFALSQRGDRLFGLGSADTKLDALCKLFAAREFRGKRLRRSLELLGTYEEEVGAKGARHFIGTPQFQARFVACSEPSELTIIRAHKGYAVVQVELETARGPALPGPFETRTFEGRSAHSSTPHLGINAVELALAALGSKPFVELKGGTVANKVPARCAVVAPRDSFSGRTAHLDSAAEAAISDPADASRLAELARRSFGLWKELALAQKPQLNASFDPPSAVVNWSAAHILSDRATLTFDCRLLPGHDPGRLVESFAQGMQALADPLGSRARVLVDRASPAMELKEPSELLTAARAACRDVGLEDAPKAKPTNTEAGVFASAGAEAIVFGPGRSTGNAHCPNEHNLSSQLNTAIQFYRALIARICE
jgi:acetylornithine deacetylase/succinyl-diaminopimelate desuccinylase-like protein